jgi:hypothetical protein
MSWIENGYKMLWFEEAPASREVPNSSSALAHEGVVSPALAEMLEAGATSKLPVGYKPEVVSPLGVVPKGKEGKFRLIVNMSYVNDHLVTNKFKFEGLSDLADLRRKGTTRSPLILPPGIIMWDCILTPAHGFLLEGRVLLV